MEDNKEEILNNDINHDINHDINNDINEEDYSYEDKLLNIINAFQIHYKKLFKKENNENMFNEVDTNNPLSTNRSMEFLYEHLYKYKENIKNNNGLNNLYNEDDNFDMEKPEEFYALIINGDINKMSASLYGLIEYFVGLKEDWWDMKWEIINLKNN